MINVQGWLGSLSETARARVYAVMRSLGEESLGNWQKAQELGPRFGYVSVGSEDMSYVFKATASEEFLRGLRNGLSPEEAETFARGEVVSAVRKWNTEGSKSRAAFCHEGLKYSEDYTEVQSLLAVRHRIERAAMEDPRGMSDILVALH